MSEHENGQLPLAKRTFRSRISPERWEQIKVAYVSGIGLREIARKMNIPEGTVLAGNVIETHERAPLADYGRIDVPQTSFNSLNISSYRRHAMVPRAAAANRWPIQ